jgi:predicted hotdog family 3-hydroxylacyl-ACP dehydratase
MIFQYFDNIQALEAIHHYKLEDAYNKTTLKCRITKEREQWLVVLQATETSTKQHASHGLTATDFILGNINRVELQKINQLGHFGDLV